MKCVYQSLGTKWSNKCCGSFLIHHFWCQRQKPPEILHPFLFVFFFCAKKITEIDCTSLRCHLWSCSQKSTGTVDSKKGEVHFQVKVSFDQILGLSREKRRGQQWEDRLLACGNSASLTDLQLAFVIFKRFLSQRLNAGCFWSELIQHLIGDWYRLPWLLRVDPARPWAGRRPWTNSDGASSLIEGDGGQLQSLRTRVIRKSYWRFQAAVSRWPTQVWKSRHPRSNLVGLSCWRGEWSQHKYGVSAVPALRLRLLVTAQELWLSNMSKRPGKQTFSDEFQHQKPLEAAPSRTWVGVVGNEKGLELVFKMWKVKLKK